MAFPAEIFRSYDIRGFLAEVTPELARAVGVAMVEKKGARTVVIGRDMRETSPELMAAAIKGVTSMGGNVIDIGMCTTSMFNFAVSSLPGVDLGVMVTASHNPAAYNGIKVNMATSQPVPGKELKGMVEETEGTRETEGTSGTVRTENVLGAYLKKCHELAGPLSLNGAKIVLDYGNGMGATSIRPLLASCGATIIELYPEPDARFPNHEANPAVEENLADLKAAVLREHADLGIAFDGDVDRLKVVDERGQSVATDLTLALVARELLRDAPGASVVVTMNISRSTHEGIEEAGGKVIECPIGRTNVISEMIESKSLVGGEVSGHMMFRDFAYLECIDYAVLRVLGAWKRSGKKLSELIAPLDRYANSGEVNLEVHDKAGALVRIKERYAASAIEVSERDGIRCRFEDWWFIIRPSNTEPVLRLTVEAPTSDAMASKRDELVAIIRG